MQLAALPQARASAARNSGDVLGVVGTAADVRSLRGGDEARAGPRLIGPRTRVELRDELERLALPR